MNETNPTSVGRRISRFRKQKGFSLTRLATDSGISKSYLWRLEDDEGENRPSADTLYKVAQALGVTLADLMGRRMDEDKHPVPAGLRELAEQKGLSESDIVMLASIQFRGEQPITKERWEFIYNAIRTSDDLDTRAESNER